MGATERDISDLSPVNDVNSANKEFYIDKFGFINLFFERSTTEIF